MVSSEGVGSRSSSRSSSEADGAEQSQNFRVQENKAWRFTYEALTHVHSLRLFLFNGVMPVPWSCVSLTATLASESPVSSSPVVLCQWNSADGDVHKLFVPMPVCLIDYSVPFAAFARSDHIEIKLTLLSSGGSFVDDLSLLGFNYRGEPVVSDVGRERVSEFSLNSDTELLASKQGVTFYCRNCSVKLTHQPISCFRSLPSSEWRELADHWFGMCCCRDGVHTKSLMARFDDLMTPTAGVCLVGSTTCIVHRDDLVRKMTNDNQHSFLSDQAQSAAGFDNEDRMRDGLDGKTGHRGDHGNVLFGTDTQLFDHDLRPSNSLSFPRNGFSDNAPEDLGTCGNSPAASHGNGDCTFDEVPGYAVIATNRLNRNAVEALVEPHSCCSGSGASHGTGVTDKLPQSAPRAKTLANGFMSTSPSSHYTPFKCHNCASLIGVCLGGMEEGLQLFKCYISSDSSTGGLSDIFRFHTLDRVFSSELFSNAEEDSSYRYIARDLISRLPLLQLVIINQDSWNCSGFCAEEHRLDSQPDKTGTMAEEKFCVAAGKDGDANGKLSSAESGVMTSSRAQFSPVFLEPVMTVMFCDTSSFSSEAMDEVESWGKTNQADDVYMLDSEVESLARSLQVNRKLFPESSAVFQQFHLSFLAR